MSTATPHACEGQALALRRNRRFCYRMTETCPPPRRTQDEAALSFWKSCFRQIVLDISYIFTLY